MEEHKFCCDGHDLGVAIALHEPVARRPLARGTVLAGPRPMRATVLVLVPSVALADPSNRSGERISIAPSVAMVSRTTETRNFQTSDPFMESGKLDGHGVGAHLELAPVWQLGRFWLGPLFRVGRHWMTTDERRQADAPLSRDQSLTYLHVAPQLTLTLDRFYLRADVGFAHVFSSADGLPSQLPAIEAGIEIGVSHPIGAHATAQLGLGIWTTWARSEEEGDTTSSKTRGHLIALGLNWSTLFDR